MAHLKNTQQCIMSFSSLKMTQLYRIVKAKKYFFVLSLHTSNKYFDIYN